MLLGLIIADPFSYLNVEPGGKPTLGATAGVFKMPDLVRFVG